MCNEKLKHDYSETIHFYYLFKSVTLLRGHNWMFLPIGHSVKNLILFSIRVKELSEPIVMIVK